VNSMREFSDLPPKPRRLMVANVVKIHRLLIDNLAAERGDGDDNDSLAGLIITFFPESAGAESRPRPDADYEED
jgi:hypothetical protein